FLQLLDARQSLREIIGAEIFRAPVGRREFRVRCKFSAEAAFVEGHARDDADVHFLARREKIVLRRLIENVADHLHRVDQARTDCFEAVIRLPAIQAQAEPVNPTLTFQFLDGVLEFGLLGPSVVPNMKLQDVDFIDAKLFADQARVLEDVLSGKHLAIFGFGAGGPLAVHGRNFRGGIEPLVFVARDDVAEQAVALAVAIGPGRVEEVAAEIDGELQRFEGFAVVRAAPAAHAPEPVSDVAYGNSGAAKPAIFHEASFLPGARETQPAKEDCATRMELTTRCRGGKVSRQSYKIVFVEGSKCSRYRGRPHGFDLPRLLYTRKRELTIFCEIFLRSDLPVLPGNNAKGFLSNMKKTARTISTAIVFCLTLIVIAPAIGQPGAPPQSDIDQRVEKILGQMTIEEKIDYIAGNE